MDRALKLRVIRSTEPPSSPAAEPPCRRAAQQPSRPAAEPPSSQAAQQPSRPAAEPPSSRAAQQPSRPAAEPPSQPTVEQQLFLPVLPGPPSSDWGVPPPPSCPLLLLLLRPTSLVSSRSALRLPLAGDAAPARARGARALEGLAGAVEVVVEAVEGVGVVVGVVAGVAAAAGAVEAEEAAVVAEGAKAAEVAEEAEVEEAAEAAATAVDLVAALRRGVAPVVRDGGTGPCTYVLRTGDRAGEQCGGPHSTQRCFGRLTGAWRHQFPGASEIPLWGELSRAGVAIFDLDFDAILAAMYAVDVSVADDCYLCVPPDPGIEAAALGARASAAPGASASAAPGAGESALSGTTSAQALHTFTLDSGASRSFFRDRTTLTPLSRPVAVSLADPSGGPVLASFSTVLPCSAAPSGTLSGLYLPSFSTNLVNGADLQDRGVDQFTPASQRVTHCTSARTSRHLATFTRRPGSSVYTLTTESPPAADGQGRERYFLLVVDDYSRYTTVFPLRNKGDVTKTFTLPASPPQNGIAERRIGMVMDVARTSMMHAAAPHFLWPFAVQYAAHQLNLQPRVSLPETSPTLRWTGKVDDASAFRVWGSRAFVHDLSADKLSPRAVPCVFLGFPPDAPGWQFYHPTSRRVLSSQDVTFDESVPYYRLFPYRTAPLPPPPLFLAPGPPPVDPLPPQGPAPSGVSQVDAVEPVEVAVDSGAARGAEPSGAGSGGAETGGAETGGADLGVRSLGALGVLVWPPAVLRRGRSLSLHRSYASGLPAAGDVLLEMEVLLLLLVPKVLVLAVLELLGPLELVLLELLAVLVLQELELLGVLALVFLLALVRLGVLLRLLELELLELELLGVLALAVLLALVLLRVLELALLELEVLLALVLPLGLLVLSLLVLEAVRGRGRTLFRSWSRFLVSRPLLVLLLPESVPSLSSPSHSYSPSPLYLLLLPTLVLLEVLLSVVSLRLVLRRLVLSSYSC
ncbi:unnamed protein product [Closterium sp. NIES-64]|nr:unnamed protein product [Closterium sp. NIES-64]